MRPRLTIEYDGTDFSGWAAQPGFRTVEGEPGGALDELYVSFDRLAVAGRTDAGVHALAQVASVEVEELCPSRARPRRSTRRCPRTSRS